ncbi:hypothetical protein COOONC_07458 [Cooperia oncophora]
MPHHQSAVYVHRLAVIAISPIPYLLRGMPHDSGMSLAEPYPRLEDAEIVHAWDAKAHGDAASVAIAEVWRDTWSQMSALARKMRPVSLTSEQKATFLTSHLEGVARHKVEELDDDARKNFDLLLVI